MNSVSFKKNLLGVQEELLRFAWMYTIMRNIFINNYRKIVRDQTFVDHTDNLYH